MARFALYSNGKKIETLDELKENFNIKDMENNFRTKSLHRWLAEKGLRDELQRIENIPSDGDNSELLMECFALSDEQKNAVQRRAEDEAKRVQEDQKKLETSYISQDAQSISDTFNVILLNCSGNKVAMIKEVRGCSDLDLKEAKILVESLPQAVIKNLSLEAAEAVKATLERAGGTVEIRKSVEDIKKADENLKITWKNDFYNSPTDHLVEKLHNLMVVANEKIILCDGYDHFFESENGMTWSPIKIAENFYCHRVKKFNDKIVFFNTLPPQYGEFYTKEGTYVSTDTNLSYWNVQHTEPALFDFYFDGSQFWSIDFSSQVTAGIMSHITARDIDETVIFKGKCVAAGLRDKDQQPAPLLGVSQNQDERNIPFSSYIMTRDPEGRFHLQMTTPTEGRQKKYQHINLAAFDDAVFMMVRGTENEETKRAVFFSYDGENWKKLNVGFDFVVKINNTFFAYSKDYNSECYSRAISAIYYSVDGINWETIEPPAFTEKADFGGIIVPDAKKERVKRVFLSDFIVYKDKLLGLLSNNKFVFGEVSAETAETSSNMQNKIKENPHASFVWLDGNKDRAEQNSHVAERIKQIIGNQLAINPLEIKDSDDIIADLGADEEDIREMQLSMSLEFDVEFDDLTNVGQIIACVKRK